MNKMLSNISNLIRLANISKFQTLKDASKSIQNDQKLVLVPNFGKPIF